MMRLDKKRRALERDLQHLTPAIDRVTGEDREFFERHKDRSYRLRLACRAEIAACALVDGKPDDLPEDMAWYSAFRQVRPGIRLRVVIAMCERADVDIFLEAECRKIYEEGIGLSPKAAKIGREAERFFGEGAS